MINSNRGGPFITMKKTSSSWYGKINWKYRLYLSNPSRHRRYNEFTNLRKKICYPNHRSIWPTMLINCCENFSCLSPSASWRIPTGETRWLWIFAFLNISGRNSLSGVDGSGILKEFKLEFRPEYHSQIRPMTGL